MHVSTIAGIFVGGKSTRMGGRPKGLLEIGGETIVARWRRIFDALGVPCVLVGANDAYAPLGMVVVRDRDDFGPLAGVEALCAYAKHVGATYAIAVACDMPYVSSRLVSRLLAAPPAKALAPRVDGKWQPFFARYAAEEIFDLAFGCAFAGQRSLQTLLDEADAVELALSDDEKRELRDWDSPEDITP